MVFAICTNTTLSSFVFSIYLFSCSGAILKKHTITTTNHYSFLLLSPLNENKFILYECLYIWILFCSMNLYPNGNTTLTQLSYAFCQHPWNRQANMTANKYRKISDYSYFLTRRSYSGKILCVSSLNKTYYFLYM